MPTTGRSGLGLEEGLRSTREPGQGVLEWPRVVFPTVAYDSYQPWPTFAAGNTQTAGVGLYAAMGLSIPPGVVIQELRVSCASDVLNGWRVGFGSGESFRNVLNNLAGWSAFPPARLNAPESVSQCQTFIGDISAAERAQLVIIGLANQSFVNSSDVSRPIVFCPPLVGPAYVYVIGEATNVSIYPLFLWQERPAR